jgi:uncharacterized protein YndB with AHSA1/START domain
MSTLQVEAFGSAAAAPETVWALVANSASYAEWGPWEASGDRDLAGKASGDAGTTRWMRYHNTTTVEQILEVDRGRRMVYTVMSGIPVRNYRAEVTLTPTETGTDIRWTAQWDGTLLGRIVHRSLRTFYPAMMALLVAAAERSAAALADTAMADPMPKETVTAGR